MKYKKQMQQKRRTKEKRKEKENQIIIIKTLGERCPILRK
jgi:hypothetical protein